MNDWTPINSDIDLVKFAGLPYKENDSLLAIYGSFDRRHYYPQDIARARDPAYEKYGMATPLSINLHLLYELANEESNEFFEVALIDCGVCRLDYLSRMSTFLHGNIDPERRLECREKPEDSTTTYLRCCRVIFRQVDPKKVEGGEYFLKSLIET